MDSNAPSPIQAPTSLNECKVQVALGLLSLRTYVIEVSKRALYRTPQLMSAGDQIDTFIVYMYGLKCDLDSALRNFAADLASDNNYMSYKITSLPLNDSTAYSLGKIKQTFYMAVDIITREKNRKVPYKVYNE